MSKTVSDWLPFHTNTAPSQVYGVGRCLKQTTWLYVEHTFSSIIHNLGRMLNNWSELGGLSAQWSFACSWWICGIRCTLHGERGNKGLSCVSVFIAHSLINYSARPSDCDLQLWGKTRDFPAKDGSMTVLYHCTAFHAPARLLLQYIT